MPSIFEHIRAIVFSDITVPASARQAYDISIKVAK